MTLIKIQLTDKYHFAPKRGYVGGGTGFFEKGTDELNLLIAVYDKNEYGF